MPEEPTSNHETATDDVTRLIAESRRLREKLADALKAVEEITRRIRAGGSRPTAG